MWFKNLQIYKIQTTPDALQELGAALASHLFAPCSGNEEASQGFASPRGTDKMVHIVNGQALMLARFEKKNLPSKVVEKSYPRHALNSNSNKASHQGARRAKNSKSK